MTTPDLLVVEFATAGVYALELIHFDAAGGEGLELSAMAGEQTAFSAEFKLVGDLASSGLAVTSERAPPVALPVLSVLPVNAQGAVIYPGGLPAFDGNGFATRTVFGNTTLGSLAGVQTLLTTPDQQRRNALSNPTVINYGGGGNFSRLEGTFAAPGDGRGLDHFAIVATAKVMIPSAGEWTFGVASDDGFRLSVGTNSMESDGARAFATSLATWTFAAAGEYDLELLYFEGTGGEAVELFAAPGNQAAFNSNFRLVGDTALGGLAVKAPAVPVGDRETAVEGLVATRFVVQLASPIADNGTYAVEVAPTAYDSVGNRQDQDADGLRGEAAGDVYRGQFVLERKPFRVAGITPTGIVSGALTQLEVRFSGSVQAGSFTSSDVRVFGSLVNARITAVTAVNATTYRVDVEPITAEGDYQIWIGPGIADLSGTLMNQDGDLIAGEAEDRYETSVRVESVSPRVREHFPVGVVQGGLTAIDVVFSEPVALSTFTLTDVLLTGPGGAVVGVTAISLVGGSVSTYRLNVPALMVSGEYTLVVGPNITDVSGRPMDQDEDGTSGEATEDQYRGTFTVDATGPRVTSVSASGDIASPVRQVDVIFSEAVVPGTFTGADVRVTGPLGTVAGVGVTRVDAVTYRVAFPQQTAHGEYVLEVGPDVTDVRGNPMDQDADGVNGEAADVFRGTWRILLPDLVPSNLVTPRTAQPGQTVVVTWRTTNAGNAAAPGPWTETLLLSMTGEPTGPAASVVTVGAFQSTDPLAPGASVERSLSMTVPIAFSGTVTAFVWVDFNPQRLVESDENNFISTPLDVQVGPPPVDLVVDAISNPAVAVTGAPVDISWTARNAGALTTEQSTWTDRVILSRDAELGADDLVLGTLVHTTALASGASYSATQTFTIPEALAAGSYTVFVVTDALSQVSEPGAENNNARASSTPLVISAAPGVDLTIARVVTPAVAVIGGRLEVQWTVRNTGLGSAGG
ncbi:MAG: Ig-like domain-containing protein, partial [Verrucomicrobiales bacterium]|nr:Ig-like domain-containing protein [Verrucomicrobiales bacterium]